MTGRWTAKEQPPGGATALLDDGTVAAVIYRPWGLALGSRIAALLNGERPNPATTEPTLDEIGAWLIEHRGWDSADVDELREGMACARAALIREQGR